MANEKAAEDDDCDAEGDQALIDALVDDAEDGSATPDSLKTPQAGTPINGVISSSKIAG